MSTLNTTRAPREKTTPDEKKTTHEAMTTTQRLSLSQILSFYFCSGMAAVTNLVTRYILSSFVGLSFALSVTVAYLLGMAVNYLLNKHFTFPDSSRRSVQEVRSFVIVALVGLALVNLLSVGLLHLIVWSMFHGVVSSMTETIAHGLAVAFVSVYSLLAHKYFTFDKGLRYGIKRLFGVDNDG